MSYLIHYASKWYDPAEASEYNKWYYETHKKASTRSGTLNEAGKIAAARVKDQLQTEKKTKTEASAAEKKTKIETAKNEMTSSIETYTSEMQTKIDALKRRIKAFQGNNKKLRTAAVNEEISNLREINANKKAELKAAYTETATAAKEEHKSNTEQYKSDYETTYEEELDKIYADPTMLKTKTSTSSSSSTTTSSKKKKKTATNKFKYVGSGKSKYRMRVYE